jgi:hypothetical protein
MDGFDFARPELVFPCPAQLAKPKAVVAHDDVEVQMIVMGGV